MLVANRDRGPLIYLDYLRNGVPRGSITRILLLQLALKSERRLLAKTPRCLGNHFCRLIDIAHILIAASAKVVPDDVPPVLVEVHLDLLSTVRPGGALACASLVAHVLGALAIVVPDDLFHVLVPLSRNSGRRPDPVEHLLRPFRYH